jgi:hypothetical protein
MTSGVAAARRAVAALALAAIAWGVPVFAEAADRELYAATLSRERALRATFSGTPAPDVALKDLHSIVAAYQTLVRRFPASGLYSDDALWNAGRLELDGFVRFGDTHDRDAGVRLLHRLAADYPESRLARRVMDTLATLDKTSKAPVAMAVRSTPAATIRASNEASCPMSSASSSSSTPKCRSATSAPAIPIGC